MYADFWDTRYMYIGFSEVRFDVITFSPPKDFNQLYLIETFQIICIDTRKKSKQLNQQT